MRGVRLLNAVLALVTELLLLAAFVWIGLRSAGTLPAGIVLAVLFPVLVLGVWAGFTNPRAPRRLPRRSRVIVETALFALAVLGLAVVGLLVPALVLAALAAARLVLGARLGEV